MKIGVYDSGLGGLTILKTIVEQMPQYDFVYLGDTLNMPYGNKTQTQIFKYVTEATEFLFKQDCEIVLIMCNTASTRALRRIQQEYLPSKYPDRHVLGPIIPTLEAIPKTAKRIGLVATKSTVDSGVYVRECEKYARYAQVIQKPSQELASLLEAGKLKEASKELEKWITPLLERKVQYVILGCTHYSLIKDHAREFVGDRAKVISQDEIIPSSLQAYLANHPELESRLSKQSERKFFLTKRMGTLENVAKTWFGRGVSFELARLG